MSNAFWNPADSDDEVENAEDFQNKNRNALLCVIDATPNMFRPCWGDNEDSPFLASLKCCHALWRSKIASAPKDIVGILLCGSEQQKNSSDFPNLYVLQELSTVTVNMILELDALKKPDGLIGFEENIGSSSDYKLKEMFWLAKIIFEDAKASSFGKKIIYFTCEDDPHSESTDWIDLQNEAVKKFRDLGSVDFQVVTFNQDFDNTKFYSKILEDEVCLSIPHDLTSLLKVIRIKQRRQRPVYHSTLQITSEFKIGVGMYSMARRTLPPKPVKVNKRNNETVTKLVTKFRADTGMPVLMSEQVKLVEVKGEQAIFTKDELKNTTYDNETGLTILAFLDQTKFDQYKWFRCGGYFLYPDDERWSGSKDFFTCLLRRCLVLKKCILVRIVLRAKPPKLGCLLPVNGDGDKIPQGFYCFMLPFADEIRNLSSLAVAVQPSTELMELMEQLVKKTTQKTFDLLNIQNPVLQMKWREIESAVFNNEDVELEGDDFQDFTQPNVESMSDRIGGISRQIMRMSERHQPVPGGAKKPKVAVNMQMEAKNKRLEKLTCDILKEFLDGVGVDTKFKRKADLVALTYGHFAR